MARKLRAKSPDEVKQTRSKFLISGGSGDGKTWVALDFPGVYYIDTEGGATEARYQQKLKQAGGVYFGVDEGSQDFNTVIEEVITLATVEHDHRTLVIDSFTKLYNTAAAIAEETVGNDFGRDKKEAQKPTRRLIRWLERLDMNVILICHQKDKWERRGGDLVCTGTTFDGWDKLEYELDLWLEIGKRDKQGRATTTVRKSRLEGFPMAATFPWSYAEVAKRYGEASITAAAKAFSVATPEQVKELEHLVKTMSIDEAVTDKWLTKAQADTYAEMPAEAIQACIDHLKAKLQPA